MRFGIPLVIVLVGCRGTIELKDTKTTTTSTTASTTTETTVVTTTETTGTTGTTGTTETTGTTGTTVLPCTKIESTDDPNAVEVSNLSWRLHDDIESMAYISWTQNLGYPVHIEYTFENGEWLSTPSYTPTLSYSEQIIVGVPFDYDVDWRIVVEDGGASYGGGSFTTGPLPSGMPTPTVTISEPAQWLPEGKYILSSINEESGGWTGGHYWTFIMDRKGRMVWVHEAPDRHWTLFAQVALSGDHFLWDESTYWSDWDSGAGSTIHKTWLDEEIAEYSTPGLHHAWVQIDDETIAWGSQDHGGKEALVERTYDGASETIIWTCEDDWPDSGNCESNGIFYQQSTESFLYSFYTNDSMVEVDRFKGNSMWWAGDVNGGYSFNPGNSQYSWQHGVSYTDTGSLLVSTEAQQGGWTTMVREYTVDHDAEVLNQIWSYDAGTYASTNGDAWRLSNGNTLHLLGSASEINEVTPDGDVIWNVDFNSSKLLGRGEFIADLYTKVKPQ